MEAKWFAGRLRELREAGALSREALAERAGIKTSAVRDIEQAVYSPNWETVVALCRALGVGCDAFLEQPAKRPRATRGRPPKSAEDARTPRQSEDVPPARQKSPGRKKEKGQRRRG
jgi:transcriptional regulator with XRE-family HTH domain